MDRDFLPVSVYNQSVSGHLFAGALSSPLSMSFCSHFCGSLKKQESQDGEQVGKNGVFTALAHVTDVITYMIQDIVRFSKSLRDFR